MDAKTIIATLMCVGTAREAQIISGVITRMSLMLHGKS